MAPNSTVMPNQLGLGEDEAGYGSLNPSDPYIRALLRRQLMAQQLAGDDRQERMTHWLQPVAHAVNRGLNAWMAQDYDDKIRDYTRQQRETADRAFSNILPSFRGATSQPEAPQPKPVMAEGGAAPGSANAQDFIKRFAPEAIRISKETGLDPRLVLAQSANETGWGAKAPGNNYFGIKGPGQTLNTTEVVNGQRVPMQDTFRAYETPEASFSDYAKFIRENPRYAPVLQAQGLENQIAAMGKSGYATDPQYAQKLNMLARGIQIPESPQAPVQVAQAPTGTMTDAGGGATVQVPGVGPMNREQIKQMTAMILMNPNLSADPRYARMAQGLGALAQSIPEPKLQAVSPGGTLYDPRTGRVVFQAPEAPDRDLVRVTQPDGSERLVPRSQAANMVSAPPVSPRPQMLDQATLEQQARLARERSDRSVIQTGENKLQGLTVEDFRKAQAADVDIAKRATLLNRMDRAIGQFPPGRDAPIRLWAGQIGNIFGVKTEGLSEGETANMIASRLAIEAAPKGQGQVSNYERSLFAAALPQMTTTLEGTRKAIQVIRDLDSIDAGVAKIYRDNARRHGGLPDPISVAEEIAAFSRERSGGIQEALAPYSGASGGIVRVSTPDEAAKLPPGTEFIGPDGQRRRVPGGAP